MALHRTKSRNSFAPHHNLELRLLRYAGIRKHLQTKTSEWARDLDGALERFH
jgi:hypothetical protein